MNSYPFKKEKPNQRNPNRKAKPKSESVDKS